MNGRTRSDVAKTVRNGYGNCQAKENKENLHTMIFLSTYLKNPSFWYCTSYKAVCQLEYGVGFPEIEPNGIYNILVQEVKLWNMYNGSPKD